MPLILFEKLRNPLDTCRVWHWQSESTRRLGVEWILPLGPTDRIWLSAHGQSVKLNHRRKERLRGCYSSLCVRVCYAMPISVSRVRVRDRPTALCTKCMSWSYLLLTVFRPWTLAALGSRGRTQSSRLEARKAWKCPVDEILRKRPKSGNERIASGEPRTALVTFHLWHLGLGSPAPDNKILSAQSRDVLHNSLGAAAY